MQGENFKIMKMKYISNKIDLIDKSLQPTELALVLQIIARQHYNTSLPVLLRLLDKVSGSLRDMIQVYEGDQKKSWTQAQDELLYKHESLLVRWKGNQNVKRRKKYLEFGKDQNRNINEQNKQVKKQEN